MKRIILALLCLFSIATKAQTITKDSLITLMAKEACVTLSSLKEGDVNKNNFEEVLGKALIPLFIKYAAEIETNYGDGDKSKIYYNVGRDIGKKMAGNCPVFLNFVLNNTEAITETLKKKDVVNQKEHSLKGKPVKIVTGDLSYIEFKTDNGKIEKLYWLEYFEGATEISNSFDSYTKKSIEVIFENKEVYNASLKEYITIKVIQKIKL